MDDRQRQIVEGAGLEESRLNTDFIEWLRKWGTPILMVVVVISGAYAAWNWWERREARAHEDAYLQMHATMVSGSPDNMLVTAREHKGRGAVWEIATLGAANEFLEASRRGVVPGGDPSNDDDRLTPENRESNLRRALELYQSVASATRGKAGMALHEVQALFGIAAAQESLGELDAARASLEAAGAAADRAGFTALASIAQKRRESIDELASLPRLYEPDEVASRAPMPAQDPFPGSSLEFDAGSVGPLAPGEGGGSLDFLNAPPADENDSPDAAPAEGSEESPQPDEPQSQP